MKKVLLVVIDGCPYRVLKSAVETHKLPAFAALAAVGVLSPCTAVFPSITPAATTSIVTGCYPYEHGIGGACWYDSEQDRVLYFGDDAGVVWNKGVGDYFRDFVVGLNKERIRVDTIFQAVEGAGRRAASLNYLVFRGPVQHTVKTPLPVSLLPGVPSEAEILGPSIAVLGDFLGVQLETGETLRTNGGLFHRFGFEDEYTGDLLVKMAAARAFPDLTVAYFPNFDYTSHDVGPEEAAFVLEGVDKALRGLVSAYGAVEHLLAEMCVVITADHAHANIAEVAETAAIDLRALLSEFKVVETGREWQSDEDVIAEPNLRAAQVYFRRPTRGAVRRAIDAILSDERVDQVAWMASLLEEGNPGYFVAKQGGGLLQFWAAEDGASRASSVTDSYGGRWECRGDLSVVDANVEDGRLVYGSYPNAFERLAGALAFAESGHLWVTALPGYEFLNPPTKVHPGGGSHGSLHELDSIAPLLIAGFPAGVQVPLEPRTVDVMPLCLSAMGLEPRPRQVGAMHLVPRGGSANGFSGRGR